MVTLPHSRDTQRGVFLRDRVSLALSVVVPTAKPHTLSPRTAVDEQNAQTQEQERIVLGLSESEGKKDLKLDDRVCHSGTCGVAKCRSLRKGTVRPTCGPPPPSGLAAPQLAEGGFRVPPRHCCGRLAVRKSGHATFSLLHPLCPLHVACVVAGERCRGRALQPRTVLFPESVCAPQTQRAQGL